jgi:hypothetical protein
MPSYHRRRSRAAAATRKEVLVTRGMEWFLIDVIDIQPLKITLVWTSVM